MSTISCSPPLFPSLSPLSLYIYLFTVVWAVDANEEAIFEAMHVRSSRLCCPFSTRLFYLFAPLLLHLMQQLSLPLFNAFSFIMQIEVFKPLAAAKRKHKKQNGKNNKRKEIKRNICAGNLLLLLLPFFYFLPTHLSKLI